LVKGGNENELIKFYRSVALPGVELMTVRESARYWRVLHEQYAFCANQEVAAEVRYRQQVYTISDYSTLILEPGETHVNPRVLIPQNFDVLFFTPVVIQQYCEEIGINKIHFRPIPCINAEVFKGCRLLGKAILQGACDLEQESLMVQCLETAINHHGEIRISARENPSSQPLLLAQEYLHEHFHQAISLHEIAAIAGLSRFHFLKTFKKQFGLAPHAYQLSLRISRSLSLLRIGMPLIYVAEIMGFSDQSHFCRHFKRIIGVTPGQYRSK
jgi:AraC-like DNA-binding protein